MMVIQEAVERTVSTTVTQTGTASTGTDHAHPEIRHTVVTESALTMRTVADDDEMSQQERTATVTTTIVEMTAPKIGVARKIVQRNRETRSLKS